MNSIVKTTDDASLPEITLKVIILSILLTIILGAANAYLGLKVGLTVSASIPAAVISMGVLRFFKNSNILENNIVQTCASAGEALAAGVAFTLPALIVLRLWMGFDYWETFFIALVGGALGVLFTIPLRRTLLKDESLRFPEGTAIGNVLKASDESSLQEGQERLGIAPLVHGGLVGSVLALLQTGFKLVSDGMQIWTQAFGSVFGVGLGFAPALIAAGYIVGINTGVCILIGVILGWIGGVPIIAHFVGVPNIGDNAAIALNLWTTHIRYIGVGTMLVGGLWTVFGMLLPMIKRVVTSVVKVAQKEVFDIHHHARTDRDIPTYVVLLAVILLMVPLFYYFKHFFGADLFSFSNSDNTILSLAAVSFILVISFMVASICAYFAGLVGSSLNPTSGMSMIALIIASFLLLPLLDWHGAAVTIDVKRQLAGLAIVLTTVVAGASSIGNDNMQDLKAGSMVGATPWKQQVMLLLGVTVAAFIIPLVLQLLFQAYGLAGVFPREGMDPSQMLLAPQAGLMAAVVTAVFDHNFVASQMIGIGAVIAFVLIVLDKYLRRFDLHLSPLAVGLGIYLPFEASTPLIIGALASYVISRRLNKIRVRGSHSENKVEQQQQKGLLLACGIVAGAAIMGVLLAIPFVLMGSSDALSLAPASYGVIAEVLGFISAFALCYWMYRVVIKPLS